MESDYYKDLTRDTYERYAEIFDQKFQEHFDDKVRNLADNFLEHLTNGKRILDLGSGPGNHAAYFRDNGCQVTCLDYSESMLALCREKGLETILEDIENLYLPKNSYDGIWAYCSLLHVSRPKMSRVVVDLANAVKNKGILGLAMVEGRGQGLRVSQSTGGRRFFSFYTDEEIRAFFSPFDPIICGRDASSNTSFLNYLMRLRD